MRYPALETETNVESPWHDCTPAAGSMLVDWYTAGAKHPTHQALRAASGVPISEGMGLGPLRQAVLAVTGIRLVVPQAPDNQRTTWVQFVAKIRAGQGAVLQGLYAALPLAIREKASDPSYKLGHAVYIGPEDTSYAWLMDPLARDAPGHDYIGDPISFAALAPFAQRFVYYSGGKPFVFCTFLPQGHVPLPPTDTTQGDPMLVRKFEKWHTIPAGAPYFDGVGGKVLGTIPGGVQVETGGETQDGAWRLVARGTTAPLWIYCHRSDLIPVVQGGDPAYDGRVEAALGS